MTILRWCLLLTVLLTMGARAHPILQNPMWIEFTPEGLEVRVDVSVRELIVVQGLPQDVDGMVDEGLAEELAPKHMPYLLDHLTFRADGLPLAGSVVRIEPPKKIGKGLEGPDRAHFNVYLVYPFGGVTPRTISVSHRMCVEFPSAPGVPWDFSYAYRFGPKGAPPQLGALYRDREVVFTTGLGPVAGAAGEEAGQRVDLTPERTRRRWAALAVVWSLPAGLGSGGLSGKWRRGAAVAWLAAFLGMNLSGAALPEVLAAFACGSATVLLAMEQIHEGRTLRRRGVLLVVGAAMFGLALAGVVPVQGGRPWLAGLLAACLLAAAGAWALSRRLSQRDGGGARAMRQVVALAAAGGAVVLMLQLAGVVG